jgi:hypothetical protein
MSDFTDFQVDQYDWECVATCNHCKESWLVDISELGSQQEVKDVVHATVIEHFKKHPGYAISLNN